MEYKSPYEITLDRMTPEQRELAIQKTNLIRNQLPWVLKSIKGKYFPEEVGINYDNIGSWFGITVNGKHRLQIICTNGKGIMLRCTHQDGGDTKVIYYDCSKMFTGSFND